MSAVKFQEHKQFFLFIHYFFIFSACELFTRMQLVFGARGGVVVKALRYKPAGRGFDSRWCHWNFSVT
jgi:hypothetical protein